MKESKAAGFDNVDFRADFEGGKLVSLIVFHKTDVLGLLTAEETVELHDWLNDAVLGLRDIKPSIEFIPGGQKTSYPVQDSAVNPLAKDFVGALVPLEDRGSNPTHKITDAESVKHIVPLDQALKRDGMVLEHKVVAPTTVTFTPGGKK